MDRRACLRGVPLRRWRAALVVATTLASLASASTAHAEPPAQQGWWWAAQNDSLPDPVPAPPDVPADGLLVEGGPQSPLAIAAVLFVHPPDLAPSTVTLPVAPSSATSPADAVHACSIPSGSILAQQGGAMANAPDYDCTAKTIPGAPSPDGRSYSFDVAGVGANGTLALAILPNGPTDRVVFSHPGADALRLTPSGATGSRSDLPDTTTSATAPPTFTPYPAAAPLFHGSVPDTASTAPAPAVAPVEGPASGTGAPTGAPFGTAALAGSASPSGSSSPIVVLLPLLAAVTAALLWTRAAHPGHDHPGGSSPGLSDDSQ